MDVGGSGVSAGCGRGIKVKVFKYDTLRDAVVRCGDAGPGGMPWRCARCVSKARERELGRKHGRQPMSSMEPDDDED